MSLSILSVNGGPNKKKNTLLKTIIILLTYPSIKHFQEIIGFNFPNFQCFLQLKTQENTENISIFFR